MRTVFWSRGRYYREDFICDFIYQSFTPDGTEDEYVPESDSSSEDGLTTKKRNKRNIPSKGEQYVSSSKITK